jgi:hypothetical protein
MSRNTETLSISVTKELAEELRAASRRTGIPMARIAAQGMRHRIDELRADRAGIQHGVRRALDSAAGTILDLPPGTRLVTADGKEPTPLDVGRIAFVDGAEATIPGPPVSQLDELRPTAACTATRGELTCARPAHHDGNHLSPGPTGAAHWSTRRLGVVDTHRQDNERKSAKEVR